MSRHLAVALVLSFTALSAAATAQDNSTSTASASARVAAVRFERPRTVYRTDMAAIESAERETFDLINKKRAEMGIEPLIWSDKLATVARMHSDDMAEFNYFSHHGNDGSMVDDRADKLGISRWTAIGENIAFTRAVDDAPSFAVDRWMESVAHKNNLLDKRWKETGIGIAILPDGTYYFTEVFLLRD